MQAEYHSLQALIHAVARWVNRHQQHVIEYLVEENRALKESLGGIVPRLNDSPRRRLAAKAKILSGEYGFGTTSSTWV